MKRAIAIAALATAACSGPATPLAIEAARDRALFSAFSPLPPLPPDPTNRVADDPAAARLGHRLFFDPALSRDGQFSCASCHQPAQAFADGLPVAVALDTGTRNTPSLLNVAHQRWQGWGGKADSVWHQSINAMESPIEQGAPRSVVVARLREAYRAEYEAVFGPLPEADEGEAVDLAIANVGKAFGAYVRKLVTESAPFDRFVAGDDAAMSAEARLGGRLFIGKASCATCHSGPLFSDGDFHNVGAHSLAGLPPDGGRALDLPALLASPLNAEGAFSDDRRARPLAPYRPGPAIEGQFKTPILRNVALTAPYWHSGAEADLAKVVAIEAAGGATDGFPGRIDDGLMPVALTEAEIQAIVAFLASLSGPGVAGPWGSAPVN